MVIYKEALNAIAAGEVQEVNEESTPNYTTINELKGAGYVSARDDSADDFNCFNAIAITLQGRAYLAQLNATA